MSNNNDLQEILDIINNSDGWNVGDLCKVVVFDERGKHNFSIALITKLHPLRYVDILVDGKIRRKYSTSFLYDINYKK